MADSHKQMLDMLGSYRIRPSLPRVKVLEYLLANRVHPTADQVFRDLKSAVPGLSRATVYNTLNRFARTRLVRVINIEDTEMRYDIETSDHGHFKCLECGRISDFEIRTGGLEAGGLEDHVISDRSVYFKGLCPRCLGRRP